MAIEIPKESAKEAVLSIRRYFEENMDDEIGNLEAEGLLQFFVEEIGPIIYNKAVADVQSRLQARIAELDVEFMRTSSATGESAGDAEPDMIGRQPSAALHPAPPR